MARIVFSGIVSDGYGSIGGLTLSRNVSGPIIRSRVKGINGKSPKSSAIRSRFYRAASSWRTLSLADMNAWRGFAPAGLNGFQTYLAYYLNALKLGFSPLSSPVSPVVYPPVEYSSVDYLSGSNAFEITILGVTPPSTSIYFMASAPVSAGTIFNKKFMRHISTYQGAPTNFWNLGMDYLNSFGHIPQPGYQVFISLELFDNSAINAFPPVIDSCIVS